MDAGANGVKVEGYRQEIIETLSDAGVLLMGHVALLPQTAERYKLRGKHPQEAEQIFQDALQLDKTGVFSIISEMRARNLRVGYTFTKNTNVRANKNDKSTLS